MYFGNKHHENYVFELLTEKKKLSVRDKKKKP